VRLTSREALRIFDVADIWAARTGQSVTLVSANDHVHSRASAHYEGLAVDLHSSAPDALAEAMRLAGFTVLWRVPGHFNHLHVEAGQDAARTLAMPMGPPAPPRRRGTAGG
jgi:D-alanyl-D-alanine dipeptidase